ncbi:hypothetical protein LshimejAT787_1801770 [Lyophyllum shimeji]|uniref:Tyr recombinase domain-containing protein n=1 Tax=Lyophyllum shimeji TaxID=47721 RepID=A0A9P3PZH0_LYOSH|nr:hypothetical protein LshimejAT787_1801770 [Lyophyllum shimeji]
MTGTKTGKNVSTTRPRRRKVPSAAATAALPTSPTIELLLQAQAANRAKFSRPSRTASAYKGHLARGRAFLRNLVAQRRESGATGATDVGSADIDIDLLEKAFDNPPNRLSAYALELFLIQKCVVENLSKCTAHGIQAAFADLWDNMDGDTYAGDYIYNKQTDTVHGCPARAANIKNLIKTFTKKAAAEGASATREHAEAMKIEDLEQVMAWSEHQFQSDRNVSRSAVLGEGAGAQRRFEAKHLMMRAFMSSGFTLWTRNFELCRLPVRNFKRCVSPAPYHTPYIEVLLDQRKGWQSKAGFEASLENNRYNVYRQDVPAMDMYTHLLRWLDAYECFLGRPLLPDDYVFPFISPNGTIDSNREMSHDVIQRLLSEFVTGAGLPDVFTTHSFRRGGAQYRFIFAPFGKRWSLNIIRWWGGWAAGENVDTLMKYLIDSLNSREKTHMDMLNPAGPSNIDKSFTGHPQPQCPPEFWVAAASSSAMTSPACICTARAQESRCTPGTPASPPMPSPSPPSTRSSSPPQPSPSTFNVDPLPSANSGLSSPSSPFLRYPPHRSQISDDLQQRSEISPSICLAPNLGRKKGGWRRALDQWYKPDSRTKIAIKDWPEEWYRNNKALASLRSGRQSIAEEFERRGKSHDQFLDDYPLADEQSYSRVLDRIRQVHGRRRKSKNGTPEARGAQARRDQVG